MGVLDRLKQLLDRGRHPAPSPYAPATRSGVEAGDDERAVERYRYLLQTAPPDQIERAHEEAFAQLTPDQRRQVLQSLTAEVPDHERTDADDPRSLARVATRAEMRSPGTLMRSFGGGGMGMGGLIGGSLLGSVAGAFIGSAIAHEMFDGDGFGGDGFAGEDAGGEDMGTDAMAADDVRYGDDGGGDFGGGDFGGDFGGGDF